MKNLKTLPCDHCGEPQPWASLDATRVLCPICAPHHRFKRAVTDDFFAPDDMAAHPEEVAA